MPIKNNFRKFQTFYTTATSIDCETTINTVPRRTLTIQHYRLKNEHDRRVIVPFFSHRLLLLIYHSFIDAICGRWLAKHPATSNRDVYIYTITYCVRDLQDRKDISVRRFPFRSQWSHLDRWNIFNDEYRA